MSERLSKEEWEASIKRVGVVVGCIVRRDGKYLMVQENQVGAKGLWNLPAGHVDKSEALEAAAIREAKEETGYDVKLIRQVGLYHESAPQSVKHVYEAEIVGGEERAQVGEIARVAWHSFDEIVTLEQSGQIRAPWVFDAVSKFEHQV